MNHDEILHSVQVTFDHRVVFTENVFSVDNPALIDLLSTPGRVARAAVFVDRGLHEANPDALPAIRDYFRKHSPRAKLVAEPALVPGGERCKRDPSTIEAAIRLMHDAKLCRHSYAVIVGGGAVLDAIGYAASLVHRGLRQIRVPSTTLAQCDAGIGIKNGVDYGDKKNFLGVFYPPHAVINDCRLLTTLDAQEWRNGMAEAIKVALIRDGEFFEWIEASADQLVARDLPAIRKLIRRCAELHLRQIAHGGDPFERGSARPLDFGHWSAHKIEQLSGFKIGHGHAVAIGMAIDVLYSARTGLLSADDAKRVLSCLDRLGFELDVGARLGIRQPGDTRPLLDGLVEFQEHLGGELTVSMLDGIGVSREIHCFDHAILTECVVQVLQLAPTSMAYLFCESSSRAASSFGPIS